VLHDFTVALSALLILPVPILLLLALRKLVKRTLPLTPLAGSGPSGNGPFGPHVREPRRPRPTAGSGAVALEIPHDDVLDDAV